MEIVIILIMILASAGFVLKLTFMRLWQMAAECTVVALTTLCSIEFAMLQSKTQIQEWLQTPELMLDAAVILTIDVALQITFCISQVAAPRGLKGELFKNILLFIPAITIFPVSFYLLVYLMFYLTGTDFYTMGYGLGFSLILIIPAISLGMRYILSDKTSRLELLFYLNCIIGILGIISTVNGRNVTVGISNLNIPALITICVIAMIGYFTGFLMYKHKINKLS